MPSPEYDAAQRARLLGIARAAIAAGVRIGRAPEHPEEELSPALMELRATFVTLMRQGVLRGCTGSLEALRPLAEDVAQAAYQSAFHDPRFHPLSATELTDTKIEISVLSPMEQVAAPDQAALLARLRPGLDGLVLAAGARRATFLPKVWESLPDPHEFVTELKRKAGMAPDVWPEGMIAYRYHTETFAEP